LGKRPANIDRSAQVHQQAGDGEEKYGWDKINQDLSYLHDVGFRAGKVLEQNG